MIPNDYISWARVVDWRKRFVTTRSLFQAPQRHELEVHTLIPHQWRQVIDAAACERGNALSSRLDESNYLLHRINTPASFRASCAGWQGDFHTQFTLLEAWCRTKQRN